MFHLPRVRFSRLVSSSPCVGFSVEVKTSKWRRSFLVGLRWRRPEWNWAVGRASLRYGCSWIELGFFYLGYSGWIPKTTVSGEYDPYVPIKLETPQTRVPN